MKRANSLKSSFPSSAEKQDSIDVNPINVNLPMHSSGEIREGIVPLRRVMRRECSMLLPTVGICLLQEILCLLLRQLLSHLRHGRPEFLCGNEAITVPARIRSEPRGSGTFMKGALEDGMMKVSFTPMPGPSSIVVPHQPLTITHSVHSRLLPDPNSHHHTLGPLPTTA